MHALCEVQEHEQEAAAFLGVHWYEVDIKALAREQDCAGPSITGHNGLPVARKCYRDDSQSSRSDGR